MEIVELETFIARPNERAVATPNVLYGCTGNLFFTLLGPRPSAAEARSFMPAWRAALGAPPHASLFDAHGLEFIDPAAFEVIRSYIAEQAMTLSRLLTAQAVVFPDGFHGSAIAGFYQLEQASYPVRLCRTRAEALTFLGLDDAAARLAQVERAWGAADPIVAGLRLLLRRELSLPLATAARELGASARSLQRRLAEAGTTFVAERSRAQVEKAQQLLLETDDKVATIAFEVGCASSQAFAELFRRQTGETPTQWRAARKTLSGA